MRRLIGSLALIGLIAAGLPQSIAAAQTATDYTVYVDPMIGTYPPGFVNPGPVLPHGMVAVGPDTEGPLNYGGYHYGFNNTIVGFSHIHMSAGVPRGGEIPVMPVSGSVDLGDIPSQPPIPRYASPFSHATETAEVGHYGVLLARYGIQADLTATMRAALHRYEFPAGQPASIVFDTSRDLKGYHSASVKLEDDGSVTGHVVTESNIEVYFAASFDKPAISRQTFSGTTPSGATTATGNRVGAIIGFGPNAGQVQMKVGISFTDVEGAKRNVAEEIPGWDFDAVRAAAKAAWNDALGVIEVEGATNLDKTSFYTALYHARFFPNRFDDVDGRYRGFDDVVRTSERPRYTQFSLWDSYRGQNQLLSVIDPTAYGDMIDSLLEMARQGGTLPRWTFANTDQGHMSGDPVIQFIGEGWCRGVLDDFDADGDEDDDDRALRMELFDRMRERTINNRPGNYDQLGYSATPQMSDPSKLLESGEGQAGTTLEYGLAEFALALMADDLELDAERDTLLQRSLYHRNLLDPQTGWIRPRDASGEWVRNFQPESDYGFQEGTSWQYSWLAMHDIAGLMARMQQSADGSREPDAVERRLDTFFNLPASGTVPVVWPKVQNTMAPFGLVYKGNQYAPGNEHDLEAPFMYNYAGAPWKTQAVARGAASLYTATPDGLPGNDDLGALSGWLVWTMLGVYPITPGSPVYTIASPVFTKATLHLPHGDFVIDAPDASAAAKYIQSATLVDDKGDSFPLTKTWFTHGDVRKGATLQLAMDAVPNLDWGTGPAAAPPSISTSTQPDGSVRLRDFACGAGIRSEGNGS
jgi:predicted alpha-1,2-mannosidase